MYELSTNKGWTQHQIADYIKKIGPRSITQRTVSDYLRLGKERFEPSAEPEPEPETEDYDVGQQPETHVESTTEAQKDADSEADINEDVASAAKRGKSLHRKWKSWKFQSMLLWLGNEMGLDLWVAKDDTSGRFEDIVFSEMPRMCTALPAQNYENVRGVIERIDVMWLEGDDIVAAFEVEESTKIYSGLLRLSDLRLARPTPISLSVVAKPSDKKKVKEEVDRLTFKEAQLRSHCTFIPYDVLEKKFIAAKRGGSLPSSWRTFLEGIAEKL